jgi:ATP/maltotriose-dependent transcriptional regulator MalT
MQALAVGLALDASDLGTARAWLEAHDRWLEWSGAVLCWSEAQALRAQYHWQAGDLEKAREHAERALTRATELRQPLALLGAHRLIGELEIEAGQFERAAAHLDGSLALAEACGAPYERALTLLAFAELRAATGETEQAGKLLNEVRAICEPLGAKRPLTRVDALAARLAASRISSTTYPDRLSLREVEVLRLLAGGSSNQEIANTLSISVRTVERHITNLYAKIGAHGRADATAYALRYLL